jgi:hypothetical protein
MPQLAVETYFSQFFWLFIIFFLFNDFILHKFIPSIATIFKVRKLTSSTSAIENKESNNKTLTVQLPTFNIQTSAQINNFNDARVKWINNINK